MKRKYSMIVGMVLLAVAFLFVGYAFGHPEESFPWSNRVTFMLYGTYIWLIFECLFDIPLLKNKRKQAAGYSIRKAVAYFAVAVVFFLMEVTGSKVGVYSVVRGFIVICGIEMGIENICWWVKNRAR